MAQAARAPSWAGLAIYLILVGLGIYCLAIGGLSTLWTEICIHVIVLSGLTLGVGLVARLFWVPDPAKSMANAERALYSPYHELRVVQEGTIRAYGLDQGFYDRVTAALADREFRRLPDYVDVTAAAATPWARFVIRPFLSGNGTVMGAAYHVRIVGWPRVLQWVGLLTRRIQHIDFETELSDGHFVATSNAADAAKISEFPGISRFFLPADTPPRELEQVHADHVRRVLAARSGTMPLRFATFEDVCASQNRQHLIKSQVRKSPQFDHVAEMARVIGRPLSASEQELAAQMQKNLREPA